MGVDQDYDPHAHELWTQIHDIMAREIGQLRLGDYGQVSTRCQGWFLIADAEPALDMIELTFRIIEHQFNEDPAKAAVQELNHRFREHDPGYQYENGKVIRLDNQYVHAELIKPALSLITAPLFQAGNDDFMLAHRHYRDGNHKDCVVAAQRAFESALKAICRARGWSFASGDRAVELITVCRKHGLFPDYLDRSFDTYVAMLKTGLPGVRNNAGGHGQEPDAKPVPEYLAAYALHLTAANIVLAVEAFREGKPRLRDAR
jgi:hypothetical protein